MLQVPLMRLLHIIKMIFNVSSFYNSSERVASLLVKITNQVSQTMFPPIKSRPPCFYRLEAANLFPPIWSHPPNIICLPPTWSHQLVSLFSQA
jgi:hypothetical protein